MNIERLKSNIISHEGESLLPYPDSEGIWTIGVGHNMEVDPRFTEQVQQLKAGTWTDFIITRDQMYALLHEDIQAAIAGAELLFPRFHSFSDTKQEALVEMVFQMGVRGVSGFKNMCAAINSDPPNWPLAIFEAMDSEWHWENTPARAVDVVRGFLT